MKTTDNTTQETEFPVRMSIKLANYYNQCEAQRDTLQTELGNTQFALEEMVAQRDAALAALRQAESLIRGYRAGWDKNVTEKVLAPIRAVIAASQGDAQPPTRCPKCNLELTQQKACNEPDAIRWAYCPDCEVDYYAATQGGAQ